MRGRGGLALVLGLGVSSPALACSDWPEAPGVHVAPSGRDDGTGGRDQPFGSVERALEAVASGGPHRIFVEGGRYVLERTLSIATADSFVSVIGCPSQPPVLDAGPAGLATAIALRDTTGVTLTGLTVVHASGPAIAASGSTVLHLTRNRLADNGSGILLADTRRSLVCANEITDSAASGIEIKDGSDDSVVAHNAIDGTGAPDTHGGGIFVHGASRSLILRNLVANTSGVGIGVLNWDATTINLDTRITSNVVRRSNRSGWDSGAIYLLGRSHRDLRAEITHNLIEDTGRAGDAHTIGIYLDDSSSGVQVRDNVVRAIGTHGVEIHGGDDILVENNVFELRPDSHSAILFQAAPADTNPANTMRNNVVRRNIVLMHRPEQTPYAFLDGGAPAIGGNLVSTPAPERRPGFSDGDVAVIAGTAPATPASLAAAAAALIGFVPIPLDGVGPDPGARCVDASAAR